MAAMDSNSPAAGSTLFASVELSLRRMSPANRDKARVLGVFHGGMNLVVLQLMMQWEKEDVGALAVELIQTGLATPNRYNHLTLNPALCPYLRGRMESTEREALTARWIRAMRSARVPNPAAAPKRRGRGTLTVLERRTSLRCSTSCGGDAERRLIWPLPSDLLSMLGKPRLLERVGQVRDAAAALGGL
jgi:hypothetical protein